MLIHVQPRDLRVLFLFFLALSLLRVEATTFNLLAFVNLQEASAEQRTATLELLTSNPHPYYLLNPNVSTTAPLTGGSIIIAEASGSSCQKYFYPP